MSTDTEFRLVPAILKRLALVLLAVNIAAPLMVIIMPAIFPRAESSNPGATGRITSAATVEYRADRDSLVDLMLPEGVGGTVVIDSMPSDRVGEAHPDIARIFLLHSLTGGHGWYSAAQVEIHERGHLIDAAYPARVAHLIAAVAAPAPGTTAAEDAGQHFAEMGASAWGVLESLVRDDICVDARYAVLSSEKRVPGMAGALVWFIPTWERVHRAPVDPEVKHLADSLSAPYRDAWRPVIRVVEKRRQPDGHFKPWPALTGRSILVRTQLEMVTSKSIAERVVGWMLWPSATVAKAL